MIGVVLASRYEVLRELGRGGMGAVYVARDPLLDREVAVKVLPPAVLTADAADRFKREARIVGSMDHPSIVPVYDMGEHDGALFFVMPLVRGANMRSLLHTRVLRLGEVIEIGVQVAEALEYSHLLGVVHRDIKPENILVTRETPEALRARVTDFGLAMVFRGDRLTRTGTLVGTAAYLSPEQVAGDDVDARSDVYSLGTVLYESVVGQTPFTGDIHSVLYRIVHEAPASPRTMGIEIHEELDAIVMRCLDKSRMLRPQRAGDLADALRRYRSRMRAGESDRTILGMPRVSGARRAQAQPLIGRGREMEELQRRLNFAIAGECQFVVIAGEAGTGKSRLLDEIEKLAGARKIRVLHGRFVERDRAFPYQGFCEVIQDHFRAKAAGSWPSAADLSDLAPELAAVFPALSEIEEIRSSSTIPSPAADIAGPADRNTVFELLSRTLARISAGQPLLLLLEDLHAADVSVDALQYVTRRLGPTPTLIVTTYRLSAVGRGHPLLRLLESFRGDRHFAEIRLAPLSVSESLAFLEGMLGSTRVDRALADKIYEAAEGNPYFTSEIVRTLLDSGQILQAESGAWRWVSGDDVLALPPTIQQTVEKRIEGLRPNLRETLSVASILGKRFDFDDLILLSGAGAEAEDAVDELVKAGFLEEESGTRGDKLSFTSGVLRDVFYTAIPRRRRRALHRRYAEELEKRNAGRLERVIPQLLHHYFEGDVSEKVVEFGLRFAKKSMDGFSPENAMNAARKVLSVVESDDEPRPSVEAEARLCLGAASRMSGDIDGAIREYSTAIDLLQTQDDLPRTAATLLIAAETAWDGRRVDEARRWVEKGLDAARKCRQVASLEGLLSLAATLASLRGDLALAKSHQDELDGLRPASEVRHTDVAPGGRLTVGLSLGFQLTHPVQIVLDEQAEVQANVFETLLATDVRGAIRPRLCESWEVADGGRRVQLTLRRGIRMHDGNELTPQGVKTSIELAIRQASDLLPPAFAGIRGVTGLVDGECRDLPGVRVLSDDTLAIELPEALPLYPSLLTDMRTAIALGAPEGSKYPLIGSGPFAVDSVSTNGTVLRRSQSYWGGAGQGVDEIEFRYNLSAREMAAGIREGTLDVARDLKPDDIGEILQDRRLRVSFFETPRKNVYFVLFNMHSTFGAKANLRRALLGALRVPDLVRRTLGRYARPADGLLPPGILGHDPSRRRRRLGPERAQELLETVSNKGPIQLSVVVHPMLRSRYPTITSGLLDVWQGMGVEVTVQESTMAALREDENRRDVIDVFLGRWVADYDDPDSFTYCLFHSKMGHFRRFFSSEEVDRLCEKARAETDMAAREALYRTIETRLLDSNFLLPLFHETDCRVASADVHGVRLGSSPPYVNYAEVKKSRVAREARRSGGGMLHIPISQEVHDLDPALVMTPAQAEVVPVVFETLFSQAQGAQVSPWLAADYRMDAGGKRIWVRLRDGLRFHDGRLLTSRDVRHSFERLLQKEGSETRWLLSPIVGSRQCAQERAPLEGFTIHSATEFTIDLETPTSYFPALLAFPSASIIPEGMEQTRRSWREGCVGSGPFRVRHFEPGRRLELEPNPHYWHEGLPKADGLVFSFGLSPADILSGFHAGDFCVAWDLVPSEVDVLRQNPELAARYRESPRLSTYYIAHNIHKGPLRDAGLRRSLIQALDVDSLVRRVVGRLAVPARSFIPPGLLGSGPTRQRSSSIEPGRRLSPEVELTAFLNSAYEGPHVALRDEIFKALKDRGFGIRVLDARSEYYDNQAQVLAAADLLLTRWIADYPDAETFTGLLHSETGLVGKLCGTLDLDRLIERGRAEIDPAIRHGIYRELEDLLWRNSYVLPLFHEQSYGFARHDVEEFDINLFSPIAPYERMWIKR
ncbi:MAG: ABC transporter substrate-binding protein [Acidobacteriota bacterium]